jgi:tRNA(Ile)-lysidine synthase TilS/MesJ
MRRIHKKQKQHIVSQMLGAISKFSLIEDGCRVLVALSGGKDSSLLAYLLRDISNWYDKSFSLAAITVKTDVTCGGCARESRIREFAKSIDLPLEVARIRIRERLNEGQEPDCFVCSWNRRKAIFEYATSMGFNRVAFGHHRDDFAETALMNLFFNGEFASMAPRQVMFKGKLTIIRPLLFVPERRIVDMVDKLGFAYSACMCPYGEKSKRQWVKNFLKDAEKDAKNIKTNIFRSALEKMLTMEGGFTPKGRPNLEIGEGPS